jgi:hypothetical protein
MALNDENGGGIPATMLVSPSNMGGGYPYPVYGGQGNSNSGWGDGGWWIILLFILIAAMGGNWGGNYGGNGAFGSGAPIIVNDGNGGSVQRGFDQAAVMSGIGSVQNGINNLATQLCGCCGDIQTSLCNGFNGVNMSINGAQNALSQQMYANEIASLNRSFDAQTASSQGMNAIQAQLAQCCCENRLATNDVKYTIASEECATRTNSTQNTQSILNAINGGIQSIKDQLCQDKIDAKNDEIANLRQQIAMKDLAASQVAQNAFIAQGFSNEVDQLYNRLNNCPVPTTPVYGRTPIFTCNQNTGCGCGCGCGQM